MKYVFDEDYNSTIEDRILRINNITYSDIDISNFSVDYNIEIINKFKELILSYKDIKFLIVGDYDCDGICATTIIKKLFDDIGINSNYYIPSRSKEGYGINNGIVDNAYNNGFNCIFCVDNGIVASDSLAYAKKLGLHTFIIDHHEYQTEPDCDSFLHPNLFSKDYKMMCAAGLSCLFSNSFREDEFTIALGGIATLADMVPLFGYNRYLAKTMVEIVSIGNIDPINLLLDHQEVNYTNIQFNVIPKINAVSRLDDLMNVNYVVKFLLSDLDEARKYYASIETINNARKDYSTKMYNSATRLIDYNSKFIVIKSNEFKEGLCGLVANRIIDNYRKPTLVFSESGGILKGSGRSVEGFNIYEYLSKCSDLFDTFGGHELAVGISMKVENFDLFMKYIDTHEISIIEPVKDVLVIDSDDANNELLDRISSLAPYGTGIKEPLLAFKNVKYQSRYVVANKYPKFEINDILSAISFNPNFINKEFEYMIGRVKIDNYYKNKLSFVIEDLV